MKLLVCHGCYSLEQVYAAPGPDREKFLGLIAAFNSRADNPTSWVVHTHGDGDASAQLELLLEEKLVSVVVLAGKNDRKLATISRLVEAGIHVLGDKPWATSEECLGDLAAATDPDAPALAMDIMTNKHDILARIRREVVRDPALFGGFDTNSSEPCIEIGSVHHLAKIVNGSPLVRPAWYYDVNVQGNGLVDITSHMIDQVQWLLADDDAADYSYSADVVLTSAVVSDTEVPESLFCDSTGLDGFPESLSHLLRESDPAGSGPLWAGGAGQIVLPLAANGVLEYSLRGVTARHTAEWRPREPEGGGDIHSATLRGKACAVKVTSAGLVLEPSNSVQESSAEDFDAAISAAVSRWNAVPQFRGVSAAKIGEGPEPAYVRNLALTIVECQLLRLI